MQHVVGSVRGFLRFEFMRGVLSRPLHTQIDSVRTYQDEYLPYPVQWSELQQLLRRIDRSTPLGSRDYAVLLIAATYGMRASDVANLTLGRCGLARTQDPDRAVQDAATPLASADR